ncbi:transposable element Tc1 transposase [Trichonephila clavipes]|uniref:Transposable element Tc1 transposase n=1 Tax=Trichonephila clavipes TaxID=2585209 RepID=A0A8X7BIG6_TRICX|nr:transposable element Tc1 transposase [Trichonephila clavipes]
MAHHPVASFQQDNARPHTTCIFLNCLRAVYTLSWPARATDLSAIEHVWNTVGRQNWVPDNITDLEPQLVNAWQNVSHDDIRGTSITLYRNVYKHTSPPWAVLPTTDLNIQAVIVSREWVLRT